MLRIERAVRALTAYAVLSAPALVVLTVGAFIQQSRFEAIDVQRINVVEPDGKLRMVISNKSRAPDAVLGGKTFKRQGGNSAGIIFYNEGGEENGGLVFSGQGEDGRYHAEAGLLFDQFQQDQVVGLQYDDDNDRRTAALRVWERPEGSLAETVERYQAIQRMPDGPDKTRALDRLGATGALDAPVRVFVGRDRSKAAVVTLADLKGNIRARLLVDSLGAPQLEFLDAAGRVVSALPDGGRTR